MRFTHTKITLLVGALALPFAAAGQDSDVASAGSPGGGAAQQTIAASQKSSGELRRDLWKAEKDFYSLYNKLNDDNLYDVKCKKEAPTGSVLKVQNCRPKFLDRAIREGRVQNVTNLETNPELAEKIATFRENLEMLVDANPELQTAAVELNLAHARVTQDLESKSRN